MLRPLRRRESPSSQDLVSLLLEGLGVTHQYRREGLWWHSWVSTFAVPPFCSRAVVNVYWQGTEGRFGSDASRYFVTDVAEAYGHYCQHRNIEPDSDRPT